MEQTVLFGRYRLLSRAGEGGSSHVWRAVDEQTGDDVAIKRLHPVVFADPSARRRLERESRALEELDSPHIVRIRDSHLTDDEAALVLDYVPGTSLAEQLAEQGRLSVAEAVRVAEDIASALTTAHAAGVIHRDVKPANIIVAEDGRALLTDFGVARQLGDATVHDQTEVTTPGLMVGSLRYMAPEQLRGEPATPASDQYGLAAVAHEMLTGRPPYEATTPIGMVEAHTAGPPDLPDVEPALADAIRRGLAADPGDRFADVAAFAAAVVSAVRPGSATDATRVIPAVIAAQSPAAAGRPVSRATLAAGALAIGLAGIAALAALDGSGASRATPAQQPVQAATTAPTSVPNPSPAGVEDGGQDQGGEGGADGEARGRDKDEDPGNGKGKGKGKD